MTYAVTWWTIIHDAQHICVLTESIQKRKLTQTSTVLTGRAAETASVVVACLVTFSETQCRLSSTDARTRTSTSPAAIFLQVLCTALLIHVCRCFSRLQNKK